MGHLSGFRNVKATVEQLGRPSLEGQKHELKLAARKLKIPHPTHPVLSRSDPRSSQDTAIHVSRLPEVTHSAHILRRWLVRDIGWWCPNTQIAVAGLHCAHGPSSSYGYRHGLTLYGVAGHEGGRLCPRLFASRAVQPGLAASPSPIASRGNFQPHDIETALLAEAAPDSKHLRAV